MVLSWIAGISEYMIGNETDNRRAQRSRQVLRGLKNVTLDDFATAVLDTRLIAADEFLDDLSNGFESLRRRDPDRAAFLEGPVDILRAWDRRADTTSVGTTLFRALG